MRFNSAILLVTSLVSFTGCNEADSRLLMGELSALTSEAERTQQEPRRRLPELTKEQREQVRERVRHRSRAPETDYCERVAALSENQQIVDSADIEVILGSWGRIGSAADINADRIVDGADLGIALGCFEGTVPGDFDGDGVVSMSADYVLLLNMFGMLVSEVPEAAAYDLSADGVVDSTDLAIFLSYIQ